MHSKWVEVALEDIEDTPAVGNPAVDSPAVGTLVEDSLHRSQTMWTLCSWPRFIGLCKRIDLVVHSGTRKDDVDFEASTGNQHYSDEAQYNWTSMAADLTLDELGVFNVCRKRINALDDVLQHKIFSNNADYVW